MAVALTSNQNVVRYFISPNVRHSIENDGTAIFNILTGKFHSVLQEGSLVWSRLASSSDGVTLEEVVDYLISRGRFADAPRTGVKGALEPMFEKLVALGLIYRDDQPYLPPADFAASARSHTASVLVAVARPAIGMLMKFGRIPHAVLLYLFTYDLLLKLTGFQQLYRSIHTWPVAKQPTLDASGIAKLCETIDTARLWYPRKIQCLPLSAMATCLLRCCGIDAKMVTGIQKEPFKGHAWVEVDHRVVNDKPKVQIDFNVLDRV